MEKDDIIEVFQAPLMSKDGIDLRGFWFKLTGTPTREKTDCGHCNHIESLNEKFGSTDHRKSKKENGKRLSETGILKNFKLNHPRKHNKKMEIEI